MEQEIIDFIKNEKIVIAEPSSSFSQTIVSCLKELGATTENIYSTKVYPEAIRLIQTHKPKIVITEFFLGEKFGLSLVEEILKNHDDSQKIFFVTTYNSSATAVAEAAEEAVDSYILKPFSIGALKERFTHVVQRKIKPSNYAKEIQAGRQLLQTDKFDEALEHFSQAIKLDAKPTLAHYYIGHTKHKQRDLAKALNEFKSGLSIQPLHYKCLLGEFDAEFEQKNYKPAYELVPIIRNNFPISPKRLGHIFIAAVYSYNFQDIASYFTLYQQLDNRPIELTRIFSAALMAAAKFHIKNNQKDEAVHCFEMGMYVTGPVPAYIEMIIRELYKINMPQKASVFLSQFPAQEFGSKLYSNLSFLIDSQILNSNDAIVKGRKLVADQLADYDSYVAFIKILVSDKKTTLAEDTATKAIKDYPDKRQEINELLK